MNGQQSTKEEIQVKSEWALIENRRALRNNHPAQKVRMVQCIGTSPFRTLSSKRGLILSTRRLSVN